MHEKAVLFASKARAGSNLRVGRKFLMELGQCMGPVHTQLREQIGELELIANSGSEN